MSPKGARQWLLDVAAREDLVSHLVIRKENELVGYCYAMPNDINKDIMATYYIEATTEDYLKQLLAQTISDGIDRRHDYFLIDLLKEVLRYEKTVLSLGFRNTATFGVCSKTLDSETDMINSSPGLG
ncbi:MAG: hypothetical protein ACE5OZ_13445 [Candidatus Heimdallarchaeota archaeon]